MNTAREIAERYNLSEQGVEQLELDILRYLEHYLKEYRIEHITDFIGLLQDMIEIASKRNFDGVAWENLIVQSIEILKSKR